MKHIQVEEAWINSDSSHDSTTDEFCYHTQYEHLAESYLFDCITIYIKTIVAE